MDPRVRQLVEVFDSLSLANKHEAVIQILLRYPIAGEGDLPESTLNEAADELFRALDVEEAS